MIRHIFIATIKEGVTDSEIQKEMELMRRKMNFRKSKKLS